MDLQAAWMAEVDRVAIRRRWGLGLMAWLASTSWLPRDSMLISG